MRRLVLLALGLWLVISVGLGVTTGDVPRSVGIAGLLAVAAFGVVAIVLILALVPTVVPQLVTLAVARRKGFDATGLWLGPYFLHPVAVENGSRLRFTKLADGFGGHLLILASKEDRDLAARLISVWRIPPLVHGALLISSVALGFWLDVVLRGRAEHDLALILFGLLGFGSSYELVGSIREDVRSPRSIVLALKRGDVAGRREVAYTAVHGYVYCDVRPRDFDRDVVDTLAEWLVQDPTAHTYRYVIFRHLLDTDQHEGLARQRSAVLSLEDHLRAAIANHALENTSAPYVVWYAAYLSTSAEEAERIRAWIGEADVWARPAEVWFEARVAALKGDAPTALALAEEAKALYQAEITDGFGYAFEIDGLERLIASLPPVEPEPEEPA